MLEDDDTYARPRRLFRKHTSKCGCSECVTKEEIVVIPASPKENHILSATLRPKRKLKKTALFAPEDFKEVIPEPEPVVVTPKKKRKKRPKKYSMEELKEDFQSYCSEKAGGDPCSDIETEDEQFHHFVNRYYNYYYVKRDRRFSVHEPNSSDEEDYWY